MHIAHSLFIFLWLGYCDSNTGMSESESDALPLGDTPIYINYSIYINANLLICLVLQYKKMKKGEIHMIVDKKGNLFENRRSGKDRRKRAVELGRKKEKRETSDRRVEENKIKRKYR